MTEQQEKKLHSISRDIAEANSKLEQLRIEVVYDRNDPFNKVKLAIMALKIREALQTSKEILNH